MRTGDYPSWVTEDWELKPKVLSLLVFIYFCIRVGEPGNEAKILRLKTLGIVFIGGVIDIHPKNSGWGDFIEMTTCIMLTVFYTGTYQHRKVLIQTKFRLTGKCVLGFLPNHSLENSCSWQWLQSYSLVLWPFHFWDAGDFHRQQLSYKIKQKLSNLIEEDVYRHKGMVLAFMSSVITTCRSL